MGVGLIFIFLLLEGMSQRIGSLDPFISDTYFRVIPKTFHFLNPDLNFYAPNYVLYLEKGILSITNRSTNIWQVQYYCHQQACSQTLNASQ